MELKPLKKAAKELNNYLALNENDRINLKSDDEEYFKEKLIEAGNLIEPEEKSDISKQTIDILNQLEVPLFHQEEIVEQTSDVPQETIEVKTNKEEMEHSDQIEVEETPPIIKPIKTRNSGMTRFTAICQIIKTTNLTNIDDIAKEADTLYVYTTNKKSNIKESISCVKIVQTIIKALKDGS